MTFDPATIRPDPFHASGPRARLPIVDVIRLVRPELGKKEAWGAWWAFQRAKGLPMPPRAYIPGREPVSSKRRLASTLVADLPTHAALAMSLPGDAAHHRRCVEALLRHFGGDPGCLKALPHEPLQPLGEPQQLAETVAAPTSTEQDAAAAHAAVQRLSPEAADESLVFTGGNFSLRAFKDVSGELWFKGKEIAEAMGYENCSKAIRDHVDADRKSTFGKLVNSTGSSSGSKTDPLESHVSKFELGTVWVQEAGVWQLLAASRTETGKAFNRWWTGEVMPKLRRAGSYSLQPQPPQQEQPEPQTWSLHEKLTTDLLRAQIAGQRIENKKRRLEVAVLARAAAAEFGLDVYEEQLQAERAALRMASLDPGAPEDRSIDVGDYLRLRGHNDEEIKSLQVSFGVLLKKAYREIRGRFPDTFVSEFGSQQRDVCCYDRHTDRALMNAAYQALTVTALYKSKVPQACLALNSM